MYYMFYSLLLWRNITDLKLVHDVGVRERSFGSHAQQARTAQFVCCPVGGLALLAAVHCHGFVPAVPAQEDAGDAPTNGTTPQTRRQTAVPLGTESSDEATSNRHQITGYARARTQRTLMNISTCSHDHAQQHASAEPHQQQHASPES
jgi:hypothetical protein